jgi:hypothetical protein
MKCEEVQEFISVLCDGEGIPPVAAEHIGACQSCSERMTDYLKIGAELRRLASMNIAGEVQSGVWKQTERNAPSWWGKGWETMRIPRFAFALLLITIMALGSGLVMSKVRAQAHGTVLMLTYKLPDGRINRCALSLVDEKKNFCGLLEPARLLLGLKVLSQNRDQIELGVRTKYTPFTPQAGSFTASLDDLEKVEEKHHWITPGQDLQIDIPDWGNMALSGELMDHMPPFAAVTGAQMDPKPGKLQVVSPLLIRDKKVWFDFEGSITMDMGGVRMYVPGKGLWKLSVLPLEGAVEAKTNLNRVSFELKGHSYTYLMGAPVARSEQRVWASVDENYRDPSKTNQYIAGIDPVRWKE